MTTYSIPNTKQALDYYNRLIVIGDEISYLGEHIIVTEFSMGKWSERGDIVCLDETGEYVNVPVFWETEDNQRSGDWVAIDAVIMSR